MLNWPLLPNDTVVYHFQLTDRPLWMCSHGAQQRQCSRLHSFIYLFPPIPPNMCATDCARLQRWVVCGVRRKRWDRAAQPEQRARCCGTGRFPARSSKKRRGSGRRAAPPRSDRGQCWAALCSGDDTSPGEACCVVCSPWDNADVVPQAGSPVHWSKHSAPLVYSSDKWNHKYRYIALLDCFVLFVVALFD